MRTKRVAIALVGLLVLAGWTQLVIANQAFVFNSGNVNSLNPPGSSHFVALRFWLSQDVAVTDLGLYDFVGSVGGMEYRPGLQNTWNLSLWRCGSYSAGTFATMTRLATATLGPIDGSVPAENGSYYASTEMPVVLRAKESDGATKIWYIVGAWCASAPQDALILRRYDATPAIVVPQGPVLYGRSCDGEVPSDGASWFETLTPLAPLNGLVPGDNFAINFKYTSGPVANAGPEVAVFTSEQSLTAINGTATHIVEGTPMQYRWLEGETPLTNWTDVVAGKASLDLGSLPAFVIGQHTLTLQVTDGASTVSDAMTLTVVNTPPDGQPGPATQIVSINVDAIVITAEVADFDGDAVTYQWVKAGEVLVEGKINAAAGGDAVSVPDLTIPAGDVRFPFGKHTVDFVVNDGVHPAVTASVEVVVSDTTDPTLTPTSSVNLLWPANRTLRPVTVWAGAEDNGGGLITLDATVRSSEVNDGEADLDCSIASVDQQTGTIYLNLRAERSATGEGRVYTIHITATDDRNNQSSADVEIRVPHDRRKN